MVEKTINQKWKELRKAWISYKFAKLDGSKQDTIKWAREIQRLEKELNVEVAKFVELGLSNE